jgi:deoxyribose-phosphate aldolase
MQLARFIDHTVLKQTTTLDDVQTVCREAAQYGFAAVCIPPVYVKDAVGFLKSTAVKVCTVLGFPFGYHAISVKLEEARQAVAAGADELDMVLNITALKNGDLEILKQEAETLATFSKAHAKILKVIIESGILSDAEIITCCNICKAFPVNFLKTSTGFAERGASVHAVQLMRQHLPSAIQLKASGGIRTAAFARELLNAGATRLGCSASVAIVNEQTAESTY